MAKNAMIIHPEIKTIYLGIDFSMMQKAAHKKNLKIIKTTHLAKEELIPLILSLDTFKDSVRTINYNLKQKNKKIVKYGEERENNKRYLYKFKNSIHLYNEEHYKNYTIDDNYFNELKELIEYAKSKNINVVFYTTTMHITERILIDNTNNSDNFNKVKEKLAEIQPYYDFAIVDQYTTEKLSSDMKCFRDSVHNKPFLRKKLTDKLFNENSDFGVYITKDNVRGRIKEDDERLQNYIKNNQDLVQKIQEWSQ